VSAAALVLMLAAGQAPPEGERLFQRCIACHSIDPKERGLQGPNLAGVVGRPAGAQTGFEYSPAMRQAAARGLTWTDAALDRFLADAEAVVPKTEMFTPPLRDPAERRALIGYLRAPTKGTP
jgi:cytochrome c